jgi:hypothetical protein
MAIKFDQGYFNRLCDWIRKAENGTYDAYKLTNEIEKFVGHLRWYAMKNKDTRIVEIDQATETEMMYGYNFCYFTLMDLMFPGVMAVDFLPEETRLQKMNRIWSGKKGVVLQIELGSAPKKRKEEKLSEAKFKIHDRVKLENIKGYEQWKHFYMVVLDIIRVETARNNRYKCLFVDNRKKFDPNNIRENDCRWFFEYNLMYDNLDKIS